MGCRLHTMRGGNDTHEAGGCSSRLLCSSRSGLALWNPHPGSTPACSLSCNAHSFRPEPPIFSPISAPHLLLVPCLLASGFIFLLPLSHMTSAPSSFAFLVKIFYHLRISNSAWSGLWGSSR